MRIQKFEADNMRDALAQVKRALGPEAIVISTREIRRGLLGTGIEVTAALDPDESSEKPPPPRPTSPAPAARVPAADIERVVGPLRSELRSLRYLIKMGTGRNDNTDLRRELSELRAAMLQMSVNAEAEVDIARIARGHQLSARSRGRIVALVGPTGVGKTTTIAKLAARAALGRGRKVAVITLDNYRVGGEQQMRLFTDLIGVPLVPLSEHGDLRRSIDQLRDYDTVFVDTAGRSPRDTPAIHELAQCMNGIDGLEVHLTIAADTPARSIASAFQRYSALPVHRLLFTKVDEATDLTELARAPIVLGTPVSHITTGQAVPEDLEDATDERLCTLAQTRFDECSVAA